MKLPQDGEKKIRMWLLTLLKNSGSDQDGHAGSDAHMIWENIEFQAQFLQQVLFSTQLVTPF